MPASTAFIATQCAVTQFVIGALKELALIETTRHEQTPSTRHKCRDSNSITMGTAQETDAFRASFERTYKYAMESPPLSSTVVFAYRLNALALVGLIWYACEVVEGVSKGPPAAWTRWLSVAAVGGAVAVIALTYAVSYYYGHLPGFTDDDYRLSAAWDRPPATELATIGLALSLDLLPLLELARPAPARLARVIVACFTVHGIVTVAATPMSKMRGEHALSTLAFLLMLAAYTALVVATVPKTLSSKPLRAAYEGLTYASFGAIFLVFYAFSFWVRFGELYWLSVAELLALVVVFAGIVVGGVGTA